MRIFKFLSGFVFLLVLFSNIAFTEVETSERIRFAVIGDRTGGAMPGIYEQICKEVDFLHPDFITSVGDMIEGPTFDSAEYVEKWKEYSSIISIFDVPYFLTPGNNDIVTDFEEKMYRQLIGEPYYSTDYMGVHLVTLNNGRWDEIEGFLGSDYGKRQIEWLISDLEKNRKADYKIVFMHVPYWYNTLTEGKQNALHDVFVKYGVDAVFSGHYHSYFSGTYDGVKYTNIGSSGGHMTPSPTGIGYHFGWVTLEAGEVHVAPIHINSVMDWSIQTAGERKVYSHIRMNGMKFAKQAKAVDVLSTGKEDPIVEEQTVEMVLDNSRSEYPINSPVTWEIPNKWSVSPQIDSITVLPGEIKRVEFSVANKGRLFPTPTAEVEFTYAEKKIVKSSSFVNVARQAKCNRAKNIKIDGELTEECYSDSESLLFHYDGGESQTEPVQFFFNYDDENLYLAAVCADSMMEQLTAKSTEQDGPIYGEDCVGYFIEPVYGTDTLYQIYINPLGTVYDAKYWRDEHGYNTGTREWNGEYEIKVEKLEDAWIMEVRIPTEQFGISYKEGDQIRINFRRKHKWLKAACDWQLPLEWDASTYGNLNFTK